MTTAEKKAIQQRRSALQPAEALGNVSGPAPACIRQGACRRRGMSRSQFYEYKRRFQTRGGRASKICPPIHKSHPFTTPSEVVEQLLALALDSRRSLSPKA